MNWLCIIILTIPVLCIFNGLQKGMIRAAFSVISAILTLVLGFVINPYVSEFLTEKTPVYEIVQEKCGESITETLKEQLNQNISREEQNQFIEELMLPDSLKEILVKNNNAEGYSQLLVESFSEYLSHSIAQMAVGAISLIITFILVSIFMNLLGGMLNGIFSLPVLSLFNRAGGAVLGAFQGIFIVWIIFLIITMFWEASWAKEAAIMIQENPLTGYLYHNNILVRFLSNIL